MERGMDNELHFHLERYTEDLIRQGVSSKEARRRARVEFGAIEARKEECREALGLRLPVNFRLTGPICARALNFRISD